MASFNAGKGNSSGTDARHVESVLSAGGTATVATPGALTLQGAQLRADAVRIGAGSLSVASEQDTSQFQSRQKSVGVSASSDSGGSLSGSFSSTKQDGSFASVVEQSGVFAGKGGFDIRVSGKTELTGAVVASEAPAALNRLETATLAASGLHNSEAYKASSTSLGGGGPTIRTRSSY